MKNLSFARLRLMWKAMRNPRTPLPAKVIVVLGIVYALSPLDLIPDFLFLIGWVDDLSVLLAAFAAFWRLASRVPGNAEEGHRSTTPDVIDVQGTERRNTH